MESLKPRTIYALVDPRDGRVRYVGASTDTDARLNAHIKSATRRGEGVKRGRWLLDLAAANLSPLLVILEEAVPAASWRAREKEWIEHFVPGQLVNGKPGFEKGRKIARGLRILDGVKNPSADEIRAYRTERGWSQGELARRLGVSYSIVSLWESGKRRAPRTIQLALNRLARIP